MTTAVEGVVFWRRLDVQNLPLGSPTVVEYFRCFRERWWGVNFVCRVSSFLFQWVLAYSIYPSLLVGRECSVANRTDVFMCKNTTRMYAPVSPIVLCCSNF